MRHYDLVIIGTGSGNSILSPAFADKKVALIDQGIDNGTGDYVFGGTCINVGCIPTKMFVHTADLARTPRESSRLGVDETLDAVRWQDIAGRIFGRIDAISEGGADYRRNHADNANVDLLPGNARLTGPRTLTVDVPGQERIEIATEQMVLAAGSATVLPPVDGLDALGDGIHSSDTIMRIEQLPQSLTILGSGVVAAEFATMFAGLGVDVTVLARHDRVLRTLDAEVSERFTEQLAGQVTLRTGFTADSLTRGDDGITVCDGAPGDSGPAEVTSELLLVAAGRRSTAVPLGAEAAGYDLAADGRVEVDEQQRVLAGGSPVDGVYALGDFSNPYQLKHVANREARTIAHNLVRPDALIATDHRHIPAGIFAHPQIGSVGLTEAEARAAGHDVKVAVQKYGDIAYGWALEDTSGFAKVIADADGTLLGAHLIGEQATVLVQLLVQAMATGQKAQDIAATQYWIHPALSELVENALLQLV